MREWLWPVAPLAAIIYCVVYQDQFTAAIVWMERFVR